MSSFSRRQLESWLSEIEVKGGKFLDCGGSQNPIKNRLKVFKPDDYKILDLEVPHEGKKPDIICDLNKSIWIRLKEFDIVFMIEVAEYLWNPVRALENINCFLKKGGLFYSSWHFIYPCHSPVEQDFLRYTEQGVRKLLKETGFEVLEMKPRLESENSLIMPAFRVEEMRPAKDYDKHSWLGCLVKCKKI